MNGKANYYVIFKDARIKMLHSHDLEKLLNSSDTAIGESDEGIR